MAEVPRSPPSLDSPVTPVASDPVSPTLTEAEKIEKTTRERYQSTKAYEHANTISSILPADLENIRKGFQIPDQYELVAPTSADKMYHRADMKYISVHTQALKYGLRFPLHDFIITFFTLTGIALSQLLPNSYIHLISFIAFCHENNIEPAADFFFSIFSLNKAQISGFRYLTRVSGRRAIMQTPTTNKGWHPKWFYIYSTEVNQLQNWSEPEKLALGFERMTAERQKEFLSFASKIPNTPWDSNLLSNDSWLYDHGCKSENDYRSSPYMLKLT